MTREVSVRELRNHTAQVVEAVKAGERISLTVNRLPVAEIVPPSDRRSPWVVSSELLRLRREVGADPGLLADLAAIRADLIDQP